MLPNKMPTRGIKMALWKRMRLIINMNRILANKVKSKENSILLNRVALGTRMILNKMPIFAACKVPAVDGSTNLFCDNCCMMKPEMLSPMPVKIRDRVRGTLLIRNTENLSLSDQRSPNRMSLTPMKKDSHTSPSTAPSDTIYIPLCLTPVFNKCFL